MVTILTDLINYHYFFPLNEEPFSWDQFVCVISINISLWFLCQRRQWHPTPVLLPGKSHGQRSLVGCSPWGREESDTTMRLQFHFHALEKEMATHSSVLTWRIPGTAGPGGLPSMGLHRVRHDWCDLAAATAASFFAGFFLSICPFFMRMNLDKTGLYSP